MIRFDLYFFCGFWKARQLLDRPQTSCFVRFARKVITGRFILHSWPVARENIKCISRPALLYSAKRLKSKNTAKKALIYDLAGVGRLEAQQTRTANKNIFMQFSSLRLVWLWCRFILHCRGFLLHVRWACLRGFNSTRERLNGRLDCEDVINSGFVGEKSEMFIGNLSGLLFSFPPFGTIAIKSEIKMPHFECTLHNTEDC